MSKSPDFIGIGGSRCGSTWLWGALARHPQTALPKRKELHYFDRTPRYKTSSGFAHRWWVRRWLGRSSDDAAWRRLVKKRVKILRRRPDALKRLCWECRYLFGFVGYRWYRSLFPSVSGTITGEITPVYATLAPEDVVEIKTRFPDIKIIYVIRNPVDRVWSQVRKKRLDASDLGLLRSKTANPNVVAKTNYLDTIRVWREVFGDQFFLGYFDDFVSQTEQFFRSVCDFLEINHAPAVIERMKDIKVKPAPRMALPGELKRALAKQYLPMVREMARELGAVPAKWEKELEAMLEGCDR